MKNVYIALQQIYSGCKILLESVELFRRSDENISACFSWFTM